MFGKTAGHLRRRATLALTLFATMSIGSARIPVSANASPIVNSSNLPADLNAALAQANSYTQQGNLTAGDGVASDSFGVSVALSADGRTALVGAPGKTVNNAPNRGAVYVFVATDSGWIQQAELIASDGAASDSFGDSVALSGDGRSALIGAEYSRMGSVQALRPSPDS